MEGESGGGLGAGTEGVTRSNWKGAKPLPRSPAALRDRAQHSASPRGPQPAAFRAGGELSSRAPPTSSSVPPQPGPKRSPRRPDPRRGEGAGRDEQGAPGPRAAPRPRSTERPSGGRRGCGSGSSQTPGEGSPVRWGRGLGLGSGRGLCIRREGVSGTRGPCVQRGGVHASSGTTPPRKGHAFADPRGLGGGAGCPGQHRRAVLGCRPPPWRGGVRVPGRQGGSEGRAWPAPALTRALLGRQQQGRQAQNPRVHPPPPASASLRSRPSLWPTRDWRFPPAGDPTAGCVCTGLFGSTFFPGFLSGFFPGN